VGSTSVDLRAMNARREKRAERTARKKLVKAAERRRHGANGGASQQILPLTKSLFQQALRARDHKCERTRPKEMPSRFDLRRKRPLAGG